MLGLSNSLMSLSVMGESFINAYRVVLDGANDQLKVSYNSNNIFTPNSSGADRGFSISYWIRYDASAVPAGRGATAVWRYGLFSLGAHHYEYTIHGSYDRKPFMTVYGGDDADVYQQFKLDFVPDADTLYHFLWCWDLSDGDNTGWKCFVDGVKQTHGDGATYSESGTWAAVVPTVNDTFFVSNTSLLRALTIDEVAFYDDFVSDSGAAVLYNDGTPADATQVDNLIINYRFEEGSGTAAADSTGNAGDIELINGTAWEAV